MSALPKQQFFLPRTRVTEAICIPLRLTTVVASLLLTMMPLLTGCGGGESGNEASAASATVINLDPDTLYYFSVSAYNGLESACSNEVSTVTPPASVELVLAGITASLAWSQVQDPSVYAYFIHYGRQSPNQPGSCSYESSMYVASPTDLPSPSPAPDEIPTQQRR